MNADTPRTDTVPDVARPTTLMGGRPPYRLLIGWRRVEEILYVLIIGGLVLFGLWAVIARNLGHGGGANWMAALSRHMLLWLALLGAITATGERRHITIDVVTFFLSRRYRAIARSLNSLFTGLVCGVFGWFSFQFALAEMNAPGSATVLPGVPEWLFIMVLPAGFAALAVRCCGMATMEAITAIRIRERALGTGERLP